MSNVIGAYKEKCEIKEFNGIHVKICLGDLFDLFEKSQMSFGSHWNQILKETASCLCSSGSRGLSALWTADCPQVILSQCTESVQNSRGSEIWTAVYPPHGPRTVRASGFDPEPTQRDKTKSSYLFEKIRTLSLSTVWAQGRRRKGNKGLEASPDTPRSSPDTPRSPPSCPPGISMLSSQIWMNFEFEWC